MVSDRKENAKGNGEREARQVYQSSNSIPFVYTHLDSTLDNLTRVTLNWEFGRGLCILNLAKPLAMSVETSSSLP